MKISPVNQINFKASETIQQKSSETKNEKPKKQHQKNTLAWVAVGLATAGSIFTLIRTDKVRLEKIVTNYKKGQQGRLEAGFLDIEIKNFKNNENVKSLDDLSGLENIKEFINNYQILLKNPDAMKEHNVKEFSSILLWGLPGTGKTSAAKGIAKKLDADYIQIDKEFFDSMFVSEAPKTLAEMFDQIECHAKEYPKRNIVVFMDEIDGSMSINTGSTANHSEDITNTLKRGLTYLQEECDNIIFIGATNKDPNGIKSDNVTVRLNPAVLSRFKYQIELSLPKEDAINDAWTKLMKTVSGKDKFTPEQNRIISKYFHELGMSFRDIAVVADKLNREDAVEFCQKGSYDSKANLIKVLQNDEKIGYDSVKKESLPKDKFEEIIKKMNTDLKLNI